MAGTLCPARRHAKQQMADGAAVRDSPQTKAPGPVRQLRCRGLARWGSRSAGGHVRGCGELTQLARWCPRGPFHRCDNPGLTPAKTEVTNPKFKVRDAESSFHKPPTDERDSTQASANGRWNWRSSVC